MLRVRSDRNIVFPLSYQIRSREAEYLETLIRGFINSLSTTMSPNSHEPRVALTEEPAAYDDTYGSSLSKPETELRLWDEDEWAISILNQYIGLG